MSIKPSGTEPNVYKPLEPLVNKEIKKIEKPVFELSNIFKEVVSPQESGEILNIEQQVKQEKAFNQAFENLMSKLSGEELAAFKEDPIRFLKSHPEYTKPSIEVSVSKETHVEEDN